jgi:NAD(P)-dependent dehydrogenase (short-subunit alcohol dehydrogenase family)
MDLLKGRIAIVSGIGPGVGKEVAYAFAREGADVVLAARTASALEEVALGIQKRRQKALCVPTDITKPDDCRRLVETAVKQFGRVDVLVNNAFLTHPWGPVESADFEAWKKILDVNLFGSLRLAQLVIPHMRRQGGGSIVMVNTMSMRIIEPNVGGYAASKAALMTATQTLAKELGPDGIRVNTVSPGMVQTGMTAAVYADQQVAAERAALVPLGRVAGPEDMADVIAFLLGPDARYINGHDLVVDGGVAGNYLGRLPGLARITRS